MLPDDGSVCRPSCARCPFVNPAMRPSHLKPSPPEIALRSVRWRAPQSRWHPHTPAVSNPSSHTRVPVLLTPSAMAGMPMPRVPGAAAQQSLLNFFFPGPPFPNPPFNLHSVPADLPTRRLPVPPDLRRCTSGCPRCKYAKPYRHQSYERAVTPPRCL